MQKTKKNVPLKPYNTFGIAVNASYFIEIHNVGELISILKDEQHKALPKLILGGGSNVLFTSDYQGLVIKNSIHGIERITEDNDSVVLKAGAGEVWHQLVLYAVDNGYGGIENLSLIPGTVGAAPMQNIGAYGVEIKDVFESLEALNKETFEIETFGLEDCQFGYRQSVFKLGLKGKYVITSVSLKLSKKPVLNTSYGAIEETLTSAGIATPTIKDVSQAVIKIRQSKLPDPVEIGNAGSFFKNPTIGAIDYEGLKAEFPEIPGYELPNNEVKVPAAWLIQSCGWKGKTTGEIGVHKNQALVLVNYGNGKGLDLKNLAVEIQQSVAEKFGIELEMEVNVI
ncbi:UDP-N-acetylmuramate dehydrogenase [Reichenbachiella sp. MALMAid0571]|uniref:UDP-N-acetylmuramate dehydrogenase n=1 Tax=Reichenbachiella sp. MALMAid0571 TaxID=3143939 RepID=UPI0032DE41DE